MKIRIFVSLGIAVFEKKLRDVVSIYSCLCLKAVFFVLRCLNEGFQNVIHSFKNSIGEQYTLSYSLVRFLSGEPYTLSYLLSNISE